MDKKKYIGVLPTGTLLKGPDLEYRVERVLGMGGFGITYKVSALKTMQVGNVSQSVRIFFCIKEFFLKGCDRGADGQTMTYAGTLASDVETCLKDFIIEARRLNRIGIKSKNIVKVNEVFETNGTAYYVMEFLDGGSLADYVEQKGPLSWKAAYNNIIPIALAVNLLHDEHLLHMDIKPGNIMLKHNSDNGKIFPVLIDFGISKHFDKKGNPTSTLMAKGASEGYAPTEQYTGINKFAPEIDVYALGATMFFLLTGEQPPKASEIRSKKSVEALLPARLEKKYKLAIAEAMNPNWFERTENVNTFIKNIENGVVEPVKPVEETVIINPKPNPHPDLQPAPHSDPMPDPSPNLIPAWLTLRNIVIAVCVAVVVGGVVWSSYSGIGKGSGVDTMKVKKDSASEAVKQVTNIEITNSEGRTFTYTGPLNELHMPHGKGSGVYDNGKYEGEYSNGLRWGNGTYETSDGKNHYKGSFYNDQYSEGTLTLADGVYFEGSFQGGQPYNGKWKDQDGAVISEVKNGK